MRHRWRIDSADAKRRVEQCQHWRCGLWRVHDYDARETTYLLGAQEHWSRGSIVGQHRFGAWGARVPPCSGERQ